MKYLVTGGAGFIGSHIVSVLLQRGHRVVVVDDLFSGYVHNLSDVADELGFARSKSGTVWGIGEATNLELLQTSILDSHAYRSALDGVHAVFHQAAIASVPRSFLDPAATLRVNIEGTSRLLEACREAGVKRLVMAGSSSVYGDTPTLPKIETMTPTPLSPYALSKLAGEELLAIWHREYGIKTVALRYFNVFGPRQDPASDYAAVIPKFVACMLDGRSPLIFGDGTQSRDFTYIDNVVAANLLAANVDDLGAATDDAAGQAINIGVGESATLLDLVAALNDYLGTHIEPEFTARRAGDVQHSMAAIDRATELIGYEPRMSFRDGLARTADWYVERRNGEIRVARA